jgi:hypothetical protein
MFGVDKSRRSDGVDPVTGELAAEGEANVFQIGRAACNPTASVCPPTFVHSSGAKTYPISCNYRRAAGCTAALGRGQFDECSEMREDGSREQVGTASVTARSSFSLPELSLPGISLERIVATARSIARRP